MRSGAKWQGQMDKLSFLRVYGHWNEERPNILSVFIRLFWSEPNQRQVCSMPGDWWGAMESSWLEGWNVSIYIFRSLLNYQNASKCCFLCESPLSYKTIFYCSACLRWLPESDCKLFYIWLHVQMAHIGTCCSTFRCKGYDLLHNTLYLVHGTYGSTKPPG